MAKGPSQRLLYDLLGLPVTASVAQISHAYRRLALQYHPDRNPQGAEEFKKLSNAYAVLSDPERRRIYDATGIVGDESGGATTQHGDGRPTQAYSAELEQQVKRFFADYAGSDEEKEDLIANYDQCGGDFARMVREHLLFDNDKPGEVRRLHALTSSLLQHGTLKATPAWTRSTTPASLKKIEKAMHKERVAAEAALREMGLEKTTESESGGGGGLGALQALIQQRQQASWQNMVSNLEAKYVKPSGSKKARRSRDAESPKDTTTTVETGPARKRQRH